MLTRPEPTLPQASAKPVFQIAVKDSRFGFSKNIFKQGQHPQANPTHRQPIKGGNGSDEDDDGNDEDNDGNDGNDEDDNNDNDEDDNNNNDQDNYNDEDDGDNDNGGNNGDNNNNDNDNVDMSKRPPNLD